MHFFFLHFTVGSSAHAGRLGGGEGEGVGGEGGGNGDSDGGGGEDEGGGGEGDGGGGLGDGGGGLGDGSEGDGGSSDGASRMTSTWTSTTDGGAGSSSMVTPSTLPIASRGFVCKFTAFDPIRLAPSVVSVATTVRITLPAVGVTVSMHAGK